MCCVTTKGGKDSRKYERRKKEKIKKPLLQNEVGSDLTSSY